MTYQLGYALLERLVGCDYLRHYTALLFREVSRKLQVKVDQVPEGMMFKLDSEELFAILEWFPGSKRRESFKIWTEQGGTPPNTTRADLVAFSRELLQCSDAPLIYTITARAFLLLENPSSFNGYYHEATSVKIRIGTAPAGAFLSPLESIFWQRTAPGEPLLVNVGDVVEPGQPICVLEASKTFNRILADRRMKILAIVAENGVLVKEGEILFDVEYLDV